MECKKIYLSLYQQTITDMKTLKNNRLTTDQVDGIMFAAMMIAVVVMVIVFNATPKFW